MSVLPDELTGTEQAVLLVLMARCEPVPNPELKNLGPELKKPSRDRLRERKLIEVLPGVPMKLELADEGWRVCRRLIGTDAPAGTRGINKTLYTLMKGLDRYLARADLPLADVFAPVAPDVEALVSTAYQRLVRRPGGWVGLADLRRELADLAPATVDAALLALYRKPGVSLIPEENQKTLTAADDAAAILVGGEKNHLIAIRP